MNKKTITLVIMSGCFVAGLTSCGNKNASSVIRVGEDTAVVDSTAAEDANPADPELITNRVIAIYDAVATAYPEIRDLTPSTDSLDVAFCSNQWQTLVAMVNAKDAEEMGVDRFFDADYWIMGQDWGKITVSDIKVSLKDDGHANVDLILHNLSDIKVKLEMVFERGEWLIDNFIDQTNGADWKKNMTKYLEDHAKPRSKVGEDIVEYAE
jgi:hypothetical protein